MRVKILISLVLGVSLMGIWFAAKSYAGPDAGQLPANFRNFPIGTFKLTEGDGDDCGDGEFIVEDKGKLIRLGDPHGLSTENRKELIKSDIPEEKGCVYEGRDRNEIKDGKTIVTFQSTLRCPAPQEKHKPKKKKGEKVELIERYTLTKTATFEKGKATLDVLQTANLKDFPDEDAFSYRCVWDTSKPIPPGEASAKDVDAGEDGQDSNSGIDPGGGE